MVTWNKIYDLTKTCTLHLKLFFNDIFDEMEGKYFMQLKNFTVHYLCLILTISVVKNMFKTTVSISEILWLKLISSHFEYIFVVIISNVNLP
jgi:hypothetical protein